MPRQSNTKENKNKFYILSGLTILVLFIIARHLIIKNINEFLINEMMEDSNRHAETHMSRLSNSIQSSKIIDGLLEEKLLAVANTVTKSYNKLSNELLKKISKDLNVDKIYWYNSEGEIIFSANDYLGWQAKDGDPIWDFMISDREVQIDEIRPDVDSGIHLKYGQQKIENGEFVQVGILAENIYLLTKKFCPQEFIDNIVRMDEISHAYYIDRKNKLIFCDEGPTDKQYQLDTMEEEALGASKRFYRRRDYKGEDTYEALLPIYVDGEKIGGLILFYSMEKTNDLINTVSSIAMGLLILVFLISILMLIYIGRKNRSIEKLAYYDKVTGLFNKEYFIELLNLKLNKRVKNKYAILIIKLQGLNIVKMVFGEASLNNLAREIGSRFKNMEIDKGTIFRYSEESFCIHIEDYKNKEHLISIANDLGELLDKICSCQEYGDLVSGKIGILKANKEFKDSNDILKYIEIVLDRIEETSLGYEVFDENLQRELAMDEKIERELRKEIHSGFEGFYLNYQPQVDLKTNKIIGLEALARWHNHELGPISPLKFIDIAEKFQLIVQLGDWVIDEALSFIQSLEEENITDISLSINVSVIQFLQEDFVENLLAKLRKYRIDSKRIILEVTETNIMKNHGLVNQKLELLRKEGIGIALDDFGTGYASLSRLRQLNIDILKIDKLFIDKICKGKEDIFVNSILVLAKELNLITVAEGVEKEEQNEYLKHKGCDLIQGFIFSKPLFKYDAIEIIKNNKGGGKN